MRGWLGRMLPQIMDAQGRVTNAEAQKLTYLQALEGQGIQGPRSARERQNRAVGGAERVHRGGAGARSRPQVYVQVDGGGRIA